MTAAATPERFSFGRVINRLFGVLSRNLVTFLLLSVLLVGLPTAVVSFVQLSTMAPLASAGAAADPSAVFNQAFAPLRLLLGAVALVISIVGNSMLQAAVIHASVSDLLGKRVSFGECLATGFRFFLPVFGIGLVVGICCAFGLLIFIVPGVLLALAWCVAAPAEVVERVGVFAALGRSAALTRNHRGAILGLAVIYVVALWIVQVTLSGGMMVSAGLGASGLGTQPGQGFQNLMLLQTIVQLVLTTLFASIGSAGIASIYFELRQTKEGIGAEQLASVFD
jgi:hypothetical protein